MITVKHISKSFADVQILKDVSFVFETGKTNLIIGKSGSGKSVLTKCIVGLFEPDEGEIFYDERKLSDLKPKARKEIRKEIGMLFQASALFDSLTVEENVAFPLNMFTKMTKEEISDRVNFCLNRVNIINKNQLFPSELSGGMQKRVAIARAIAMQPKYLFCDEPNSGLNPWKIEISLCRKPLGWQKKKEKITIICFILLRNFKLPQYYFSFCV